MLVAFSLAVKREKLPGAGGIPLELLKHGGDEIMNILMGIRKCICQNKNLVRVVNKVIGNIATQLPKKDSFRIIQHCRTVLSRSM